MRVLFGTMLVTAFVGALSAAVIRDLGSALVFTALASTGIAGVFTSNS